MNYCYGELLRLLRSEGYEVMVESALWELDVSAMRMLVGCMVLSLASGVKMRKLSAGIAANQTSGTILPSMGDMVMGMSFLVLLVVGVDSAMMVLQMYRSSLSGDSMRRELHGVGPRVLAP